MLAKNTCSIGSFGEKIALKYVCKKKYIVIEKNIHFSNYEIDILAKLKEKYIFFEVKTSSSNSITDPEDYINKSKLRNLKNAAFLFSRKNNVLLENIYFDLLAIKLNKNEKTAIVKHYKNIC